MALIPCKECKEPISTETDACPKCGAKIKKPSGCATIFLVGFTVLVGIAVFLAVTSSNPTSPSGNNSSQNAISMAERYPPPWRTDVNPDIAKALAQNNVTGCGVFKYRPSSVDQGEYLVYCSPDGESGWAAYMVWIPINKVTGPFKPDPSLGQ